jgi:diaminopimelate epimerase
MSGGGNDFLVLDQESAPHPEDLSDWVRSVCRRGLSVGADGVLLVSPSTSADVRLLHYNADGGRSQLCGNGTRCAARWHRRRHGDGPVTLETDAGTIEARFPEEDQVSLLLPFGCTGPERRHVPLDQGPAVTGYYLEVGIPHFVVPVESLDGVDVEDTGGALRRHALFAPQGTNASFVLPLADGGLDVRTFERGVEAETLACGTACVAAAVVAVEQGWSREPVVCHTRSGIRLTVDLQRAAGGYQELRLQGDARFIYEGRLDAEAVTWNRR